MQQLKWESKLYYCEKMPKQSLQMIRDFYYFLWVNLVATAEEATPAAKQSKNIIHFLKTPLEYLKYKSISKIQY